MKLKKISLFYGITIAIVIIVYFLILSFFGLHKYPVYSAVDIFIVGVGLFLLISKYKKNTKGVIATLIITSFFALYITELNPGFLRELLTTWKEDYSLNPSIAIFGLALMGFSTSISFSLIHMQLFKRSWNTKDGKKHTL